jgi:hypothetical protein
MSKRCHQCGGRFGLTRQRWYQYQFCCMKCRSRFLDELAADRERIRKWLGFLS